MKYPTAAWWSLRVMVVLTLTCGCFFRQKPKLATLPVESTTAAKNTLAEGRVTLHTRLVAKPAGNHYLNRGVWKETIDPLPHELSALLAANGIRVGIVAGLLPWELEQLTTNEATVVSAMLRHGVMNRPKIVPINGPISECEIHTLDRIQVAPIAHTWTGVECGLAVTTRPGQNGKLSLLFELQIQHGDSQRWLQPNADGTKFEKLEKRQTEQFPKLSWELQVKPDDIIVIGAADEPQQKIGEAFFFHRDPNHIQQRLLILQASAQLPANPDNNNFPSIAELTK